MLWKIKMEKRIHEMDAGIMLEFVEIRGSENLGVPFFRGLYILDWGPPLCGTTTVRIAAV